MISIFKLLFIIFFAYMFYNILRIVFYFGKGLNKSKKRSGKFKTDERSNYEYEQENNRHHQNNSNRIIELDKDQYKVE